MESLGRNQESPSREPFGFDKTSLTLEVLNMKKLLLFVIISAIVLPIVGCGQQVESVAPSPTDKKMVGSDGKKTGGAATTNAGLHD